MRKVFFRKKSKVISTVIPRSALDEAFVLPENEVCAIMIAIATFSTETQCWWYKQEDRPCV